MLNRKIIGLENGLAFLICVFLNLQLEFSLLLFFLLLLVPDITMVGYMVNPKIGASIYNAGHSFLLPFLLVCVYFFLPEPYLLVTANIWVAHICMDRFFGFGLKYTTDFKETRLQRI